jgi:phosphopantothenoylcysteine synthetase/decarboxylase
MNILVTAGNTQTPIDRVRAITNIFTGRTGAGIALEAHRRGHIVTLLTSHPETVKELKHQKEALRERWTVIAYRTFDDFYTLMADHVRRPGLGALIHSAAVSDYQSAGIYAPSANTRFRETDHAWENTNDQPPALVDMAAGKVKSDAAELWLRLVRTPKLVDLVRREWAFRGVLVKFKLEVGVTDEQLQSIAERSRVHSGADLIVANTLEGAAYWAFLGPIQGQLQRLPRRTLAEQLLDEVERLHQERQHG